MNYDTLTGKPEPPVRWEHIILRPYKSELWKSGHIIARNWLILVMSQLKHQRSSSMESEPCYLNGQTILLSL